MIRSVTTWYVSTLPIAAEPPWLASSLGLRLRLACFVMVGLRFKRGDRNGRLTEPGGLEVPRNGDSAERVLIGVRRQNSVTGSGVAVVLARCLLPRCPQWRAERDPMTMQPASQPGTCEPGSARPPLFLELHESHPHRPVIEATHDVSGELRSRRSLAVLCNPHTASERK